MEKFQIMIWLGEGDKVIDQRDGDKIENRLMFRWNMR